jgi:CTP:molybdopterin cytidylyltransferase MocA
MTRAPGFAGVILAAGESSRMGHDASLLPCRVGTYLSAHIEALRPSTDFVLVVAGTNHAGLEPVVDASGAFLVVKQNTERGQFSSLQLALQEVLNRGRDAALVTPVDAPPARPETIAKLRQAFELADTSVWAVVSEKAWYPAVIGREMITELLNAPPTADLRTIELQHKQHFAYLPVEEPAAQNITPREHQGITQE